MTGPIFVLGAPRSGTTLLRMMLNAHPRIVMPHETTLVCEVALRYPDSGAVIDDVEAFVDLAWSVRRVAEVLRLTKERMAGLVSSCFPRTPANALGALYRAAQGCSPSDESVRWGDKYTGAGEYLRRLAAYFPDAQFIEILRDPRDSVASVVRSLNGFRTLSGRWYRANVVGAATLWRDLVAATTAQARGLGPGRHLAIRYEELVAEPRRTCETVCAMLGLDFAPDMLEYYKSAGEAAVIPEDSRRKFHPNVARPPSTRSVGCGMRELNRLQRTTVERICGDMMEHHGYQRLCPARGLRDAAARLKILGHRTAETLGVAGAASLLRRGLGAPVRAARRLCNKA